MNPRRLLPCLLALATVPALRSDPVACPACAAAAAAEAGTARPNGRPVYDQPDRWETDGGGAFRLAQLRGRPAVVALFYTTCHVACPVTLQLLSDVDRNLPPGSPVAIVLVTLDPQTDTPAQLAECRREHRLSDRVRLLRGSPAAVKLLADAAGILFRREPARLVHAPKIVVVDPQGRVTAEFAGLQVSGAAIAQAAERAAPPAGPAVALNFPPL